MAMDCDQCREALSAEMDGERVDRDAIRAHVDTCDDCRAWRERSHRLARTGLVVAEPIPEVTVDDRPSGFILNRWLRIMLAWSGLVLLIWNLPGIFDAVDTGSVHLARHQSAFAVALGVAFLYVAWRPDRAYGMVPFSITFTLAVAVVAIVDLASGSATTSRESLHFLELAGLVMLWVLGVRVGPGRTGSRRG